MSNDDYWPALIGLCGVAIGALIQVASDWFLRIKPEKDVARNRRKLLNELLQNPKYKWRHIDTLSRVIGADKPTTSSLLIDIGARGSEKNDGMWGLISKHPLNDLEVNDVEG